MSLHFTIFQIAGMICLVIALATLASPKLHPAIRERRNRGKGFGFWILCMLFFSAVQTAIEDSNAVSWTGVILIAAFIIFLIIRWQRPVVAENAIPAANPEKVGTAYEDFSNAASVQPLKEASATTPNPVPSPLPQRSMSRDEIIKLHDKLDKAISAEEWNKALGLLDQCWEADPNAHFLEVPALDIIEGLSTEAHTFPGLIKAYNKLKASPAMEPFLDGRQARGLLADDAAYYFEEEKIHTKAQVKKLLDFLDGGHPIASILAENKPEVIIRHLVDAMDELDEDKYRRYEDYPTIAAVRAELDKIL